MSVCSPTAQLIHPGEEWTNVEQSLRAHGVRLHAPASASWGSTEPHSEHWLLVLPGNGYEPRAALGLKVDASRALPGHLLVRADRVSFPDDPSAFAVAADALAMVARTHGRILRVTAELTALGPEALDAAGAAFRAAGFESAPMRKWARTLTVDLRPQESEILAGFSQQPRRDLRAIEKLPVKVREITDSRWVPRMEALLHMTYARTGGHVQPGDWPARIALAHNVPTLTRLIGLFRTDRDDDASLVAFTWAIFHGDHATYEIGASQRQDDIRVPLLTPLLWDLIRWARSTGATWFDLGGVSVGSTGSADPLEGISDFKRRLSKHEIEIGAQWVLEPHPLRARLARTIRSLSGH